MDRLSTSVEGIVKKLSAESIAIVTGGKNGLGAEIVKQLAAVCAKVIVADITIATNYCGVHISNTNIIDFSADVSSPSDVRRVFNFAYENFGRIDIVVNNAGVHAYGEIDTYTHEDWQHITEVNLFGLITVSIVAYEFMKKARSGTIVNISSSAVLWNNPLTAPYNVSKAGVFEFSRCLSLEAKIHGINVVVVCPGNIITTMIDNITMSRFTPPITAQNAAKIIINSVINGRKIIVFPFYVKTLWWLDRVNPFILNPLRRTIIRRARSRSEARKADQPKGNC